MSNDDAGQWMRDMAFLRIGPDTGITARQLYPRTGPRITHPEGCRCPWCSELRRATGRGRRMNKSIAELMNVKDRGRTAAGQEAVNRSRYREADERAMRIREMAEAGTYPYRAAREAAQEFLDGAKRGWGDWHEPGCGCGCGKPGRGHAPAIDQVYAEAEAAGADPVWQWREVTRSIVLPDYGQIVAAVPDQPPGTCATCRTGPLFKGNRCWYCWTLEALPAAPGKPQLPARQHATRGAIGILTVTVLGCLLMSAALAGYPSLLIPGLILMLAGTRGALRR